MAHLDETRPTSSASSSMMHTPGGKADQVVHRVYLKTVGVLVESRLTHYGGNKSGERKKDKWFNLIMPDIDLHRQDLRVYSSISAYSNQPGPSVGVPPLLIAFILDTSDLPPGQALLWSRASGKVTLQAGLGGKGKGKEKEVRSGIVLERWTFTARSSPGLSASQQAAPHAYRLGIIHFRALYSLIRLLPAYRLFRRLRRSNTGLKLALKLWSPDGGSVADAAAMQDAWDVMERDLVGIGTGLEDLATTQTEQEEERRSYNFPTLDMFGLEYSLGVDYRSEVDFHVEDLESVLSEKFVDMEDDWFTPTVARHRLDSEGRSSSASTGSSVPTGHNLDMSGLERPDRRLSNPAPIPSASTSNPSPIPLRQGPASYGSFRGSLGRPSSSRVPSGLGASKEGTTPGSLNKWGALGEGLPFAQNPAPRSPAYIGTPDPPSPFGTAASGAQVTARRLSGHSIHPSPSMSHLRPASGSQTPRESRPPLSSSKPSSIGRTSSFLSQSGRSFTHAQLATIGQRTSQPVAISSSSSPPIPGTSSNMSMPSPDPAGSSASPSGLSFTKQPLAPRSLTSRPPFASGIPSGLSPSSLERTTSQSSPNAPPQFVQRYSSYTARRDRLGGSPSAIAGSQGCSGDGTSQPSAHSMLRRTSMRTSYEAGLKRSMEHSGSESGSRSNSGLGKLIAEGKIVAEDSEDIEEFLKTLDSLPQPPTIASQNLGRSHRPSSSSSLNTSSIPGSPSPLQPGGSPSVGPVPTRAPTTRAQIDAQLRLMAGSFQQSTLIAAPARAPIARSSLGTGAQTSIGLLSASRPATAPRGVSQPLAQPAYGQSPYHTQADTVRLEASAEQAPIPASIAPRKSLDPEPNSVVRKPSARSLPGSGTANLQEEEPQQLRSAGIAIPSNTMNLLSPQTTGGNTADTTSTSTSGRSRRGRGPVLLRGGFGDKGDRAGSYGYAKSSVSSSPSHSPVRDFGRLTLVQRERDQRGSPGTGVAYGERQAEEELDSWTRTATGMGLTGTAMPPRLPPGAYAGAGHAKAEQDRQRSRVGLGTAPGSFADTKAADEVARDGRGRQGRVKSEGGEDP